MKRVMVVGGGKIGVAIAELLLSTRDYAVTVADKDSAVLERMPKGVERRRLEIADPATLAQEIEGQEIVLSAMPFSVTPLVAAAAKRARAHYFDLTEDVEA